MAGHPILRVPGADNFPVFELMDVDHLKYSFSCSSTEAHESLLLRAGHFGTDDDLVSVLENVLNGKVQIGKSCFEPREEKLHTFRSGGCTGS